MRFADALHERFITWALRTRPPEAWPIRLGQRRVYVLPTRAGLAYGLVLAVMLIGAINYNLSLGYALTFLLAGLGVSAILHTFRNLVQISLTGGHARPVFAGEPAHFGVVLHNERNQERRRLSLALAGQEAETVDVPPSASIEVRLAMTATRRGRLAMPRVTLETQYPLGLIRAWAYAAPAMSCLVYPRPAARSSAAPPAVGGQVGGRRLQGQGEDDFAGLRTHRPEDPLRHVAWKTVARRGPETPLMVKQFEGQANSLHWFDWSQLPAAMGIDERLSLMTRWVVDAQEQGMTWGIRLPGREIGPASGMEHAHACLAALALYGLE